MITTRAVTSALVILAAAIPATAEAKFNLEPAGASGPAPLTQPTTPPPARAPAGPQAGFQWGDAGLGAAGAALLLGTGALAVAVPRRRRALSDSA
jgi:hypothetical protein